MVTSTRSSEPDSTDPLIGLVIADKYRIEKLIGVGGMGAVYRATQLAVSRAVAVKVLRSVPGVSDDQLTERFRREAHATSRLHHPNTVQVIDFGQVTAGAEAGLLYMVLEFLEGATLGRVLSREAPLAPERVAGIGKQIAKSLSEAHEHGIVHRDLKPDNVFICNYHGEPDYVKVMDFGIARLMTAEDNMTRTGMMIGTPKYMAPEQAMAKRVGPAADLYALGVILYEMLTGVPPFASESGMALAIAHINDAPPPLILPGYPEPLAEAFRGLVDALLMKNAEKRPGKAGLVASWLQQLEVDAQRWGEARGGQPTSLAALSATLSPTPQGGRSPLLSSLPGRDPQTTYAGPQPRTNLTLETAVRHRQSDANRAWIWTGAITFMILGGLVAFLVARPSKPRPERPATPVTTTRPAADVR